MWGHDYWFTGTDHDLLFPASLAYSIPPPLLQGLKLQHVIEQEEKKLKDKKQTGWMRRIIETLKVNVDLTLIWNSMTFCLWSQINTCKTLGSVVSFLKNPGPGARVHPRIVWWAAAGSVSFPLSGNNAPTQRWAARYRTTSVTRDFIWRR